MALLVFGPAISFGPQLVDDSLNVFANPYVTKPGFESLAAIWSRSYGELYIPLTYTVWMGIQWLALLLGVSDPTPFFHGGNIVLHAACAALVFGILKSTVAREYTWVALAGALVFLLHPLQVESVVWITGLKETLSGMLSLSALLVGLRACRSIELFPDSGANQLDISGTPSAFRGYVLAFLFCALAILAKPTSVVVPALICVTGYEAGGRGWKKTIVLFLPLFALSGLGVLVAQLGQATPYSWMGMSPPPIWLRPFGALNSLGFYFVKAVLPSGLSFDYGRRMAESAASSLFWAQAFGAALGLLAVFVYARRVNWLWRGCLQILIALVPVLGLLAFTNQQASDVADRYMYLPLLGVATVFSSMLILLGKKGRSFAVLLCACVLVAFTWATVKRVGLWQRRVAIYEDAILLNPRSAIAQAVLGSQALAQGDFEVAAERLGLSYAIRPHNDVAQQLAASLARLGRTKELLTVYKSVVTQDQLNSLGRLHYGILLVLNGEVETGLLEIDAALALAPLLASTSFELAEILAEKHSAALDVSALALALRKRPNVFALRRLADLSRAVPAH